MLFFVAINISQQEEEKLKIENESLRKEIENLRVQLILAEANNGGNLVFSHLL